jgi:beta-glucosidase
LPPPKRADQTVKAMTADERTTLTMASWPSSFFRRAADPRGCRAGRGVYCRVAAPGRARAQGNRRQPGRGLGAARASAATALPSGIAQAASWDPAVLHDGGAMIGAEARASGYNVLLAGGVNLTRDPRNGRTFEYLSEDPLLSGVLVGAAIRGIQSNHIISTIKHFALNGQETGRQFVDIQIANPAARESDLLAFQIGIEQGQPGAIMCAYNRVNGPRPAPATGCSTPCSSATGATRASSCRTGARCRGLRRPRPGWTSNRANSLTRRSISEASWPTRPPRTRPGPRAWQT